MTPSKPEPKPTAKKLAENAAKELAAAQAKSERLGRESADASAKFQAQAQERRLAFMRDWLDTELVEPHQAAVARQATTAAFEKAVEADPLMQVYLAYMRSGYRSSYDGQTAQNFASQVGVPAPRYDTPSTSTFFEVMQRVMERLASRLESERTADTMDALDRAAEGDE